jgi:predicted GNAT family N-acyltransferase
MEVDLPGGRRVVVRRSARDEILPLRHAILRPGLPEAEAHFDGDDESATIHVGAFLARSPRDTVARDGDDGAVGCVTLMRRPWRDVAWQLRGMATREDVRGRGVGAALLAFVGGALRDGPVWCNARVEAAGFYARHGWTVESEPFDVAGVGPHVVMRRRGAP